ncbi:MAG: glycosyltransferase [Armatimonadota bacterium]
MRIDENTITSYPIEKQLPVINHSLWPSPTLRHLQRLTDGCGIIQHAKFICPDYATGYCTDDNSRALLAVTRYSHLNNDPDAQELMVRYLAFLRFAQHPDGHMHNFVSYARTYLDETGSYDCLGQTIWALGEASTSAYTYIAHPAAEMFRMALPHLKVDFSPHSLAYALLGICAYGQDYGNRAYAKLAARPLADALKAHYDRERADGWEWFLDILTYANARLPQAMLCSSILLDDESLLATGLRTLDFLRKETICDGIFSPVGCHGWHLRGKQRAEFDQQPIDAGAMVEACLTAYHITHNPGYRDDAMCVMSWFYGDNVHGLSLYDSDSGGCRDGLTPNGVNENQGAESTIVHLLALLAVHAALSGTYIYQTSE